jgi:RNA polymerase sigma factor (sigma-70 family)
MDETTRLKTVPRGNGTEALDEAHWNLVLQEAAISSPRTADALEKLCRTYWYPLYAYIRRRGYEAHDAQDLTQEFFARLLEKKYFQTAKPEKGRFRSFLLASLNHFLANEWDRSKTEKRGGRHKFISLDEFSAETRYRNESAADDTTEKLFERRWAITVLEKGLARLRDEWDVSGKLHIFDRIKCFLIQEPGPGDYGAIATELGWTSGAVAVAVHRLRQRYRKWVRQEIAHTVASPDQVQDEIRHLLSALE